MRVQDCLLPFLLQMCLMHIEVRAGNTINLVYLSSAQKKCFPVAIHMIYRHEGLNIFFFLVYHDTSYTRSVFEHDVQPRGKNHITLNMDVEIKGRENKVCGGVSQFSGKQRKIQRALENNVLCVFC